ncbi:MAG TPA: DNA gyrase subunit A [Gammaproteobacteria bacterium]|nr:DNA gyrase subunit A [Gammaproteobacteria bacterium]
MAEFAKELLSVNLEDEMRESYLAYAMSVIVGRALPDVRDGLKPVHRRVLYSMHEQGNAWNKAYRKSARVVGDVMGKYHPHGDSAIYDTMVRMAQPFSLRYMLVDGQGNFGSVDGDSPAAMRYTEVRMAKIAHQLMADIDKETVDFLPNYDESEYEPKVLPSRVPNLLVNGSSGIAVGMATNIPPHNLNEIINACLAIIDNPEVTIDDLIEHVPGPDFPTAAFINGARGIREAYKTGRGKIYMRARSHFESDDSGRRGEKIVVTELPYQVNKARLLEKIAELVKDKKIEGITELRDESDKDGMRMVVQLRRGEVAEVILNNLYKQTQLQTVFGINMVALVDGQPQLLNLKWALEEFLSHRREVVTRRTIYELRKARERAHILEGLAVALVNIDEIIEMIKASPSPVQAKEGLQSRSWPPGMITEMLSRSGSDASKPDNLGDEYGLKDDGYYLSEAQAQAILDLRLHRLTGLEKDKINKEYEELIEIIHALIEILSNPERLTEVIREELVELKDNFGDERRTEIIENQMDLSLEDLISEEDVVVTLSKAGYAKAQPLEDYRAQRRGGRGKSATKMKDEDFIENLFIASTHDTILCFSSAGKVYWLKVYELPVAARTARGRPIVNLLPLEEGEQIQAVLPVKEFTEDNFVLMATRKGTVKKTPLVDFSRPRANGIIALDIAEDDRLIGVRITDGTQDVLLFSNSGKSIRFSESDVRPMGRVARGVRGIRIGADQEVISLAVFDSDTDYKLLAATEFGFGKLTPMDQYPVQNRGGQGVIAIQTSERNGQVIGAALVTEQDEVMLITNGGVLVRTRADGISVMSRNTQGVTLIRLGKGEALVEIERIENLGGDEEDEIEDESSEPSAGDASSKPDSDQS